jgi:hypothetical protein
MRAPILEVLGGDPVFGKHEEGWLMKVSCVFCGYEINLDHKVFDDYSGSIRCYCCSAIMEVKTSQGLICSMIPSKHLGESISRSSG